MPGSGCINSTAKTVQIKTHRTMMNTQILRLNDMSVPVSPALDVKQRYTIH